MRIWLVILGVWGVCFLVRGQVFKLPENISSEDAEELAPIFSEEGDTLFFVRENYSKGFGKQDIWFAICKKGFVFSEAFLMKPPLNNQHDNGICGFGKNTIYLNNHYKGKRSTAGLSVQELNGNIRPILLPNLDFSANSIGFFVPNDSTVLISMPYKDFKEDIFVSFFRFGKWIDPQRLPEIIQSKNAEISPMLSTDGKTLYFSSDKNGTFDIFSTTRSGDSWQEWSRPIPLESINSDGFEAYFMPKHTQNDFNVFVRDGDLWAYKPIQQTLNSDSLRRANTPNVAIQDSILIARSEIFFAFNSSKISLSAIQKMDSLAQKIKAISCRKIIVKGYADAVGENDFNERLSLKRAEAVRSFLLQYNFSNINVEALGKTKAIVNALAPDIDRQLDRIVAIEVWQ